MAKKMQYSPELIGQQIREVRKQMGVTQSSLALVSGTGTRFISDLEQGKSSCQLGKVLSVLHALGIKLELTPPVHLQQQHE